MKELGWKPTTMFKDGIKLTIQWYKDHMIGRMNALVVNIKSITKRCMGRDKD